MLYVYCSGHGGVRGAYAAAGTETTSTTAMMLMMMITRVSCAGIIFV